jgi:hypothetical protein
MEQCVIQASIAGVTKAVTVERMTVNHNWFAVDVSVVVRFPKGGKEHTVAKPCFQQKDGVWEVSVSGFRNSNRCKVVRWADENDSPSGWGTGA